MRTGVSKLLDFKKCTLTFADDADDDAVVAAITAKSTIGVLIEGEQLK